MSKKQSRPRKRSRVVSASEVRAEIERCRPLGLGDFNAEFFLDLVGRVEAIVSSHHTVHVKPSNFREWISIVGFQRWDLRKKLLPDFLLLLKDLEADNFRLSSATLHALNMAYVAMKMVEEIDFPATVRGMANPRAAKMARVAIADERRAVLFHAIEQERAKLPPKRSSDKAAVYAVAAQRGVNGDSLYRQYLRDKKAASSNQD